MIIEKILNMYGKVLLLMYDNKLSIGNEYLVPLTQLEISKLINSNKTTINNLFKEYENYGLVIKKNKRYYLTNKAINIAKKLKAIK